MEEEIEEFEINLDNVHISSFDKLSSFQVDVNFTISS